MKTKIKSSILVTLFASLLFANVATNAIPILDIEKLTNGVDADTPADSPLISVGDTVTFSYIVTNSSDQGEAFSLVAVTDDSGTPGDTTDDFSPSFSHYQIGDSDGLLEVDEVWVYTASAIAEDLGINGVYSNLGTATATVSVLTNETQVSDSDPSHYRNPPTQDVPEPTTLALMGLGLAGIGYKRHRRMKAE